MSRQSRMVEALNDATERLTLCDNILPSVLAVIDATAAFHLGAQRFDGPRVSGRGTEQHEDEDGVVRSGPIRPDPVGTHVVNADESTEADLAELEPWIRAVAKAVTGLEAVLWRHQGDVHRAVAPREELAREAAEVALDEARVERENETVECCWSCLRIGVRVKYLYTRVVDGDPRKLCRFCYDDHRGVGALPSRQDLKHYHSGGKRRRRVAP